MGFSLGESADVETLNATKAVKVNFLNILSGSSGGGNFSLVNKLQDTPYVLYSGPADCYLNCETNGKMHFRRNNADLGGFLNPTNANFYTYGSLILKGSNGDVIFSTSDTEGVYETLAAPFISFNSILPNTVPSNTPPPYMYRIEDKAGNQPRGFKITNRYVVSEKGDLPPGYGDPNDPNYRFYGYRIEYTFKLNGVETTGTLPTIDEAGFHDRVLDQIKTQWITNGDSFNGFEAPNPLEARVAALEESFTTVTPQLLTLDARLTLLEHSNQNSTSQEHTELLSKIEVLEAKLEALTAASMTSV